MIEHTSLFRRERERERERGKNAVREVPKEVETCGKWGLAGEIRQKKVIQTTELKFREGRAEKRSKKDRTERERAVRIKIINKRYSGKEAHLKAMRSK